MRAVPVLVAHSFRRIGTMLVGLTALLAGFEFLLTQVASYLMRHSYFGQLSTMMPDFVRSMMGPTSLAFMSFSGIVSFGYFHPMVIAATVWLSIAIATEPAGEVETRFVDLTLAHELTRLDVILRTLSVFTGAAVFILSLMMIGTWAGLTCCTPPEAPKPAARLILSLAFSLGSLMACWAGVALAAASVARRRAVAAGSVGVAALGAFLLDYVGRAWEPARAISALSPFHFFDPAQLIMGAPLDAAKVGVLLAIGATGAVIGALAFMHRDI